MIKNLVWITDMILISMDLTTICRIATSTIKEHTMRPITSKPITIHIHMMIITWTITKTCTKTIGIT